MQQTFFSREKIKRNKIVKKGKLFTGNEIGVHDMHVDDMEQDEDELDEEDNDDDRKMPLDARESLRKKAQNYLCDEENVSSPEDEEDVEEDCDGPENLCMKNNRNSNNDDVSNNKIDKEPNTKSNNNNNIRRGLSLKDIRHLNRPSHCRQSLFSGFPTHHHSSKDEHLQKSDQIQKQNETHSTHPLQQHGQR